MDQRYTVVERLKMAAKAPAPQCWEDVGAARDWRLWRLSMAHVHGEFFAETSDLALPGFRMGAYRHALVECCRPGWAMPCHCDRVTRPYARLIFL
jgi:hypothetical protein